MVSNSLTDGLIGSRHLLLPRFAMLIVCPNCATSYKVEPDSLGQEGRSVRCARCQDVWFATPVSAAVSTLPGSDDWDVVDAGPRIPSVDGAAKTSSAAVTPAPEEFATTDGIDVSGLSDEIATKREREEAEADAVLASLSHEERAADQPSAIDAPSIEPAQAPESTHSENIESFAARRARRRAAARQNRWLRPGVAAALLILAAANAGVIAGRTEIVRFLPQTASLYAAVGLPVNLRGLAFENIRMSRVEQEGVGVVVVEGSIVNVTGKPVEVPRLRLALRNDAKNEIYAWTAQPGRSILAPGDALQFRSRLASPPADARDVQVRFFSRRDIVAGLN